MPRPIVDRVTELNTFKTALTGPPQQAPSILLVQDGSGQGKSRLIDHYKEYCREQQVPVAHVDLKGGALDPQNILWSIQKDLRPLSFPRCGEALQRPQLTAPDLYMSDNKALGQASYTIQTQMTIANLSPEERQSWWVASAQAFMEDLDNLTPPCSTKLVLLFDTFEKARPETQTWLADHVLRMATPNRVACLLVVLAGQQMPDPSGEWEPYYQRLPLLPLQLTDWLEYARQVKCSLSPEQIQQCYARHGARPLKMAEYIDTFAEWRAI